MRFERQDARIGLLVISACALFGVVALHRTLRLFLHRQVRQEVHLANAADLAVGTEVQLLGLRVGQVDAIAMERRGVEYQMVATLGLSPDVVLWRGTKGIVTARMMGGPFLDLRLPPADRRLVPLGPGEAIEGEAGASPATLMTDLADLTRNLDGTVSELRAELKSRGLASLFDQPQVKGTLREVSSTLGSFEAASRSAKETFEHGRGTLEAIDANMATLQRTLAVLEGIMERRGPEVDALILQLGPALKNVQTASSDLSGVLKSAGPETEESLKALQRTLRSTQELVELLKAKPNRIVFGTPSEKEHEAARRKVEDAERSAP